MNEYEKQRRMAVKMFLVDEQVNYEIYRVGDGRLPDGSGSISTPPGMAPGIQAQVLRDLRRAMSPHSH